MTRDQVRAARILLHLRQDQLAKMADVGVATLRRYESGYDIRSAQLRALRDAVERAGAVLIDGTPVAGATRTGIGVALRPKEELPPETTRRVSEPTRKPKEQRDPIAAPDVGHVPAATEAPPAGPDGTRPKLKGGRRREPDLTAPECNEAGATGGDPTAGTAEPEGGGKARGRPRKAKDPS